MKRHRLWPLLLPIVALAIITAFLGITHWLSGGGAQCTVLKYTGLYCPGCGGTRCAKSLANGNIGAAFDHNVLLAAAAFLFIAACLYLIVRISVLGKKAPSFSNIHPIWLWAGVAIIAIFTILRNLPATPFSHLAP